MAITKETPISSPQIQDLSPSLDDEEEDQGIPGDEKLFLIAPRLVPTAMTKDQNPDKTIVGNMSDAEEDNDDDDDVDIPGRSNRNRRIRAGFIVDSDDDDE